jgi:ribulose-5-phosphate 4-epimerase/fuculose-1-phosphate aldolase
MNDVGGHVSARVSGPDILLRCRGADEEGILFTRDDQIGRFSSVGADGRNSELMPPIESPIHTAIYAARPDVRAVVHAHAPGSLLCGLTGIDVLPVRAYDYGPIRLVLEGVPTYESAALVDRPERAAALVATLGQKNACLMRGHGIVTTGTTVREATMRAIAYENAARMTWRLETSGRATIPMSEEEIVDSGGQGLTRSAATVNGSWFEWSWRYYRRLLAERDAGRMVPVDKGWP